MSIPDLPNLCPTCHGSGTVPNEAWNLFKQWAQDAFRVDIETCPSDQYQRISTQFHDRFGSEELTCDNCNGSGKPLLTPAPIDRLEPSP